MGRLSLALRLCALLSLAVAAPAPAPVAPADFEPALAPSYTVTPAALLDSTTAATGTPTEIARLHASLATDSRVSLESLRVSSSVTNKRNGVTHVYLQQALHGLDIINAVANVNVDDGHKVVSIGQSFFQHSDSVPAPVSFRPKLSAIDAVASFAQFVNRATLRSALVLTPRALNSYTVSGASFARDSIQVELKYLQVDGGSAVKLVWQLKEVDMADSESEVYTSAICAESGEVLSLHNHVNSMSTYKVLPFGINDPRDGERELIDNPEHAVASPFGWHSQGILGRNYTDTQGNNVHSSNNPSGGTDYQNQYRPDGGQALSFDFPIDFSEDPHEYVDAAITNLFYWSNTIHDFFYAYGFDEESGNFQTNNFERGGAGNDPVITFAQDGGGLNNANFFTPTDGSQGRMRMYLWAGTPRRDGDLDGGIIIHEYAHGLSNRLTGGRTNVNCLGTREPGGMGEGWGDIIATVTRTTSETTREQNYDMGGYANGNPNGIRNYIYSTNMTTNPSTYSFLSQSAYFSSVHRIGEVWAVTLYDVYWNLVDEYGFESNWFNNRSPAGNTVFIQLLIDGMKYQPCSPNYVQARDAILQADELDYGGWHKCALWRGFAKRGVGVSARGGTGVSPWNGQEAFDLPAECQ